MSIHHLNRIVIRSNESLLHLAKKLVYCPSSGVRPFSNKPSGDGGIPVADSGGNGRRAATIHMNVGSPDREINLFGPKDHRTPLPGNVGLASVMEKKMAPMKAELPQKRTEEPDVMTAELNIDRQARVLDQFIFPREDQESEAEDRVMKAQEMLECTAHSCPELLIKDFQNLFPGVKIGRKLTVVTICQKTTNDMSVWSSDMETERDQLVVHFVTLANSIINQLSEDGYWADFIDPISGTPSVGEKSNDTLYETDLRYRNFGFEIEDEGCCKVLTHHEWGTRAFVGSIFTTAPFDSPELMRLVDNIRESSFD